MTRHDDQLPEGSGAARAGRDQVHRHWRPRSGSLDIPALIRAKRAAGRPKDLEAIAELEALLVERERGT
jgi:hypothetical protein